MLAQTGKNVTVVWETKPGRRNINTLRYVGDTIRMEESEGELKRHLMRVKDSEKAGLRLNIKTNKLTIASSPLPQGKQKGKLWKR